MSNLSNHKEEFTEIYTKERWGKGAGSGSGSAAEYCAKFIDYMNNLFKENPSLTSVVDLGCGDWQYAKHVKWPEDYTGVEVVTSVF